MTPKRISKEEFEKIKKQYDEAVQARAETVIAFRDEMQWTFLQIGEHFNISRQLAQKIYRENKKRK